MLTVLLILVGGLAAWQLAPWLLQTGGVIIVGLALLALVIGATTTRENVMVLVIGIACVAAGHLLQERRFERRISREGRVAGADEPAYDGEDLQEQSAVPHVLYDEHDEPLDDERYRDLAGDPVSDGDVDGERAPVGDADPDARRVEHTRPVLARGLRGRRRGWH